MVRRCGVRRGQLCGRAAPPRSPLLVSSTILPLLSKRRQTRSRHTPWTCHTCASRTTGVLHALAQAFAGAHGQPALPRDCGLACVLMILRGLGARRCDLPAMRLLCPTTSIWTVDLAHLLCRFGLDVTFCTVTLGANPDFVREARRARRVRRAPASETRTFCQSFYVDNMEEDGQRVERLFREAAALGITIKARRDPACRVCDSVVGADAVVCLRLCRGALSAWTRCADACFQVNTSS